MQTPVRSPADLIVSSPEGLYCPAGDFHIDPWRPVARALITHAHGDHLRAGSADYFVAQPGEAITRVRLPKTRPSPRCLTASR